MELPDIFHSDPRTIKNLRDSHKQLHITYQFCGDCKIGRQSNFSISRFPVLFFRISNFGMDAVTNRPIKTYTKTTRKHINYNNLIKRLVQVFIFGVLLTLVRAPTVMSAPTCREWDEAEDSVPKWVNPCGRNHLSENYSPGSGSSGEDDRTFIITILHAATMAEARMSKFNESFQVKKQIPNQKTRIPHWLPKLPKRLGEKVNTSHLETLRLDTFLQSIYEALQKYAVGLEQVVWDQKSTNGEFHCEFAEIELKLKEVLCEIESAMYSMKIKPLSNVERSIMDDHARKVDDKAQRDLRDGLILTHSLNGVKYLIEVMEYFNSST